MRGQEIVTRLTKIRRWLILFALGCGTIHAKTVLALPFFNHTGTANLDWIGESIAETLRDAMIPEGVLVLDRADRLEAYRRLSLRSGAELTHASILKIGESLDASLVIYGSYETPTKDTLRMTARILDLQRTALGSEFSETGQLEDLAVLEYRLSWQVLQQMHWKNLPSLEEFLQARPPVRLDAVESYIRGLLAATPDQRHLFFTRAARLDEHFSQPCFQLGKIFWARKDYKIAAGWLERVTRPDSHYLEAQFFLGLCRYNMANFSGAAESFQTVAASVPLNEVYDNLGAAQSRLNQPDAALVSFRKALEGDTLDPDYQFNVAYCLWRAKQFDEAAEGFRAVLERNPLDTEAGALLARALKKEGPRPGDPKSEARERLKTNYEEAAFRQLQAELGK
jgi:tetratricopeptide (TPR) repeat protein